MYIYDSSLFLHEHVNVGFIAGLAAQEHKRYDLGVIELALGRVLRVRPFEAVHDACERHLIFVWQHSTQDEEGSTGSREHAEA